MIIRLLSITFPLLLIIPFQYVTSVDLPFSIAREEGCKLRCIASCVAFVNNENQPNHTSTSREECDSRCSHFDDPNLCKDEQCWSTCNSQMESEKALPAAKNFTLTPNGNGMEWSTVPGAVMYIIPYRVAGQTAFPQGQYVVADSNYVQRPTSANIDPCAELEILVIAFSEDGIGVPSSVKLFPSPKPTANPMLKLLAVQYLDKKYVSDFYEANGTIDVVFEYDAYPWPLGADDLEITPLFHLISCVEPDLSQGIPVPDFVKGSKNSSTIIASLGSDMMYRKCRFVYYLQSISSKKCGTMTEMQSPPANALQTIQIQCDTVENAPCVIPTVYERPICGQIENIRYQPITKNFDYNDVTVNVTVNVTFVPIRRLNEPKTLYYIGMYGEAVAYPSKEEETFLGVNITHYLGRTSSCLDVSPSGECSATSFNHSLIIADIHPKKMYGLTICAIKDPRNLTLPDVTTSSRSMKPKADKIVLIEETTPTNQVEAPPIEIDALLTPTIYLELELIEEEEEKKKDEWEDDEIYQILKRSVPSSSSLEVEVEVISGSGDVALLDVEIFDTNSTEGSGSGWVLGSGIQVEDSEVLEGSGSGEAREEASGEIDSTNTNTPGTESTTVLVNIQQHGANAGMIVGVVLGGIAVGCILVGIVIYYLRNKHRKQEKLYKLKIAQIDRENQHRYIDFPAAIKHDIWEIERRNLIIHMDKKLGSGAFGAVYLGRMIGKSLGHKDANSPLGVNLMRTENCEVAVKMLPEYADDMSKSEFLREIGLMKTLGYHERLVNMLACVTDSEPLCLIVEYCSDGDLLQHLRQRCKYMMKLDELKINYHDPPVDNNYDPAMIVTIKQLLQFAVQISYGLEYLSQKGFVHRDVAARNILVHDGNACKIGDFGLCRYIYADQAQYKSKGGRLPLKWMSPEAIRHYEFSIKSDVWSFGILLFEIITLGGSPYPGMPPEDVLPFLESGGRIQQPDNCPDNFYDVMKECWYSDPEDRIEFSDVRMKLATQLEDITEDYSYLKLDAAKDYYNVQYGEEGKKEDVIVIPAGASITLDRKPSAIDMKNTESMETVETIA